MAGEGLAGAPAADGTGAVSSEDAYEWARQLGNKAGDAWKTTAVCQCPDGPRSANRDVSQNDPIAHAVIAAKMFQHTLDAVPLQQQARIDMKDLLDVMIQQIRGEL